MNIKHPATHCAVADCCYHGQRRASSCACADEPEAILAAGLELAAQAAQRAYRAQARRALDMQMNDKAAEFGGWAA